MIGGKSRLDTAMWCLLAGAAALSSVRGKEPESCDTLAGITAQLLFTWLAATLIVMHAARPLRRPIVLLLALLLAVGIANLVELARWHDWIEHGAPAVQRRYMWLLMLAIGLVIFDRHFSAIRAAGLPDSAPADDVTVFAHSPLLPSSQILARERRRIIADMHDGLGAALVALLHHVQSGGASRAHLEQRIREALQEMRIAIDALGPGESDVGTVLGSLRYRLHDTLDASGIRVDWDVEDMPQPLLLSSPCVFDLQRILLEAITNILKHARARHLKLGAHDRAQSGIEIRIEDDGSGFDPQQCAGGLGLANMRLRAARIGATLDIRRRAGCGTVLRITLPRTPPAAHDDQACDGPCTAPDASPCFYSPGAQFP